jgi:hypothetical protein
MINVNESPKFDESGKVICDFKHEGCRYYQKFIGAKEIRLGIIRWNCCFYEAEGKQI